MAEYIFEMPDAQHLTVRSAAIQDFNEDTYIACPKCGEAAKLSREVLTSYPPQREYHCEHCGASGYILCSEVKPLDLAVFSSKHARYATHCKICGDEILIYGDERPEFCAECRKAVIAMRRALGTWHE
jgi:transcription elongation factor Elf1